MKIKNLTYLEYDDWRSSRKKKQLHLFMLTSTLFQALQHEIINLQRIKIHSLKFSIIVVIILIIIVHLY